MLRAASCLSLSAALALAATAPAAELPVIYNGTQVAQAPAGQPAAPPAEKGPLPVIINYPSAVLNQKAPADGKGPTIVNLPVPKPERGPARVVVGNVAAYADTMGPVGYNAYVAGPGLGLDGGLGYSMYSPYAGGYGGYGGYYGYAYGGYPAYGYAPGYALNAAWVDLRPPLVNILATGVRPNVGHLTSMPSVREPVFGEVVGVYYR